MSRPPAVRADTLGAWLVKARTAEPETLEHLRDGFARVRSRCVRPSYRTGLVRAGQPVLLWLSGTDAEHPAGLYASGRTTGPSQDDLMPVSLEPLARPLLRSELVEHPGLAGMEVLRMPAGSNPSYVTPQQLAALTALRPELAG